MARTAGARPLAPRDANAKLRRAQALELRIEGWTQSEIAAAVGVSQSQVSRMIKKALAEREAEDVDALRGLESERLEALHKVMWHEAKAGNVGAAGVITRIMDRRAKLLGLDADSGGRGGLVGHYSAMVWIDVSDAAGEALFAGAQASVAEDVAYGVGSIVVDDVRALPAGATKDDAITQAQAVVRAALPPVAYMKTIILYRGYAPISGAEVHHHQQQHLDNDNTGEGQQP